MLSIRTATTLSIVRSSIEPFEEAIKLRQTLTRSKIAKDKLSRGYWIITFK